ncbi:DUF6572 domain-containing protein [Pelagicoccus mobilis]|uniref:Uncharacterized protein n=1 Tax=Pelagicoccus mobilis TaxID=415221 RepID=A0A934S2J7_9BACT|nr:DUF6572 domain-containing protein [Pelagicoccus mobilis]MBK1880693.1 hypothetical protein [Pelagicoccus mobilis]
MGFESTEKIDVVARSPHTEGYDLIAVDSDQIKDETRRYRLMIEKLSSYAGYVESGQFYEDTPDAHGKEIRFCIIHKSPPNEAMEQVEAIKPRNSPDLRFPVLFYTQEEYMKKND